MYMQAKIFRLSSALLETIESLLPGLLATGLILVYVRTCTPRLVLRLMRSSAAVRASTGYFDARQCKTCLRMPQSPEIVPSCVLPSIDELANFQYPNVKSPPPLAAY